MIKRIFRSIFFAALVAVMVAVVFIMAALYSVFEDRLTEDLKAEAGYIAQTLSKGQGDVDLFSGITSSKRLTLISPDGTVLHDNRVAAATMENHANRSEIIDARNKGEGFSQRYSATLAEKTIYYAVRLNSGNVLRVSSTQSSVLGLLSRLIPDFLIILSGVALISFVMANQMSKRIVKPINTLNLDMPLENDAYDELGPLLLRMERQQKELRNRMNKLTEKQQEFSAVTENMLEGLVLLDGKANILSINKSAAKIFNAEKEMCTGNHILCLNRSLVLQSVVEGAQKNKSAEALLKWSGRFYQLLANTVVSGNGMAGIVILILDVTDKESSERNRREFTANVSHELKTPLTSISGYAEIMKNGVARPEDMRDFAGRIYDEANRLISLVEDILHLSQLDENAKLPDKEQVDLFALAQDICSRLQPLAQNKDISMTAHGERAVISGIPKILDEMICNLCDNAIKYNVPGGSVSVSVSAENGKTVLTVSDTGIGIPKEYQSHVFERFYRVDKSHSKESGGTGLGLSIVKHAALVHGAEVRLESEVGKGTRVDVVFSA